MPELKYKIFVINMQRSKDRWINICGQLEKFNVPYERIEGVDISQLTQSEIDKYYSFKKNRKTYPKPLSVGEIGCHISHIKCWEEIVKQNLDFGIVLEDDIVLDDKFADAVDFIKSNFDKWRFLRLQCEVKDKKLYNKEDFADFSLYEFIRTSGCTWGYALKSDTATTLVNEIPPFGITADTNMHLYHKFGIDVKTLMPPVVFDRPVNDSIIEDLRVRKKSKNFYPFARQVFSFKAYMSMVRYLMKRDGAKVFIRRMIKSKNIKKYVR
jgi:Glycosyltransferase involved in LPS biosynthesis